MRMKLLFVEDEKNKERDVLGFIREELSGYSVSVQHSVTSAIIDIRSNKYDIALLDMSLPLYDKEDSSYSDYNEYDPFGGVAIIEEIDRKMLTTKVIVITAFDVLGDGANQIEFKQIETRLASEYPDNFIGAVYYNLSSTKWKEAIKTYLSKGDKENENPNCG